MAPLPQHNTTCFGLCLHAWQQTLIWSLVGSLLLVYVLVNHLRSQAKLTAKNVKSKKSSKVRIATEATESLLESGEWRIRSRWRIRRIRRIMSVSQENGEVPGQDLSKPISAMSGQMASVCSDNTYTNGLEAGTLAVLALYMKRHHYNAPSIAIFVGSEPRVVDIDVADGPTSFSLLLARADEAITAARTALSSLSDTTPPEVTLVWNRKAAGKGQWSFMCHGDKGDSQIIIEGSSREEEKSFRMLFEACALQPEDDIWQMPLFSESTLAQTKVWGAGVKDFKQYRSLSDGRLVPVPELLSKSSASLTAEAIVGEGFSLCYQDLWKSVDAVAWAVKQRMHGKSSKSVVLFMGRGKMLGPSYLGTWKAGCTVVPIDIHWPEIRAKGVAEDCGAQLVVTDAASFLIWSSVNSTQPVLVVDDALLFANDGNNGNINCESLDQDDDAVVLFTSGSTGKPKGIVLSHGYVTALAVGVSETKEMSPETRALSSHSPTWMPFIDYFLGPLLQGGCLVLYPEAENHIVKPHELSEYARKKSATLIGLVPAVLDMFLEDGLPPTLTKVGVGGAAVPVELCQRVCAAQKKNGNAFLLTTGYSGTEQGDVTNFRMRSSEDVDEAANGAIMGVGRPHSGQNFVLVDAGMNLVGPGSVGEIVVSGPGLASGYLNMPRQTSDYFINSKALGGVRAARTGDLARWMQDGSLELCGRLGSMVKVRGARVDLGEVEVTIRAHAAVKDCAVTVYQDKLVAYVEPAVPGDLRAFCKDRLVAHMVPHVFEGMDELPRLSNGKVNTNVLKGRAPREDGEEMVMEMDSLGQMRKFSRRDVAEDIVLDNVRAILIGLIIQSHGIPMIDGQDWMLNIGSTNLQQKWSPWQYWCLYLLRSGGWSSLAFLSGYDDRRAEHKGYGLTYREVLFLTLWVACGFNWTMWYLPAFVFMRVLFVAWAKLGLEVTHMIFASQLFILLPAFVDLYIGWNPPYPGMDTVCTCFCPFETWPWAQTFAYHFYGYWNSGMRHSYLGHGLIFMPCYWIGFYSGKHLFPFLCKLANEKSWLRRTVVASAVIVVYLFMFAIEDTLIDGYNDQCSSFWGPDGSFVWQQLQSNMNYFALNLSMSLLYVIVIAAMCPVHLKYLAKISFSSLLFSPFSACLLDFSSQALVLRSVLPSSISPLVEMVWITVVPFMFEFCCGAAFAMILPVVFERVMKVWNQLVERK